MIATVGQSRHRTSGGIAGRQSRFCRLDSYIVSLPMTSKESIDELNSPASAADPALATQRAARSVKDYIALAIATCGVGYFPIAPGTMGSIVGVGLYLSIFADAAHILSANALAKRLTALYVFTPQLAFMLVVIFVVTMVGIWAATRTEKLLRRKDPSIVVVDEVAGQMIALLSGPFWIHTWWSIFTAFLLFRAFDIWKPYPIRKLEGLESGWLHGRRCGSGCLLWNPVLDLGVSVVVSVPRLTRTWAANQVAFRSRVPACA